MDENLRREIIMEHYQNPRHRKRINDESYEKVNTNNASCIDNLDLYVLIQNGIIEDISFDGEACAISTSSCSIMITNLIGKTVEEAKKYVQNFEAMIEEKAYDEELLEEALAYNEVYKQNNRKNCALLPYKGIRKVLDRYNQI
ncbi:MAG: SUF system NifU family Fe-S cluster assembly protein [Bacilli bacterium]|nr:SUF system NifU family Fe-S cluster assembly protein [Bacilli bacterium]